MNSTTGDFSEVRKSITDEIFSRGAHSSVKREPRKVLNLRPLNLNGIKKELEEGSEEEEKQHSSIKISSNNKEDEKVTIDDRDLLQLTDDNVLKDITNYSDSHTKNSSESEDAYVLEKPKNTLYLRSNTNYLVPQINEDKHIPRSQKNDSFDLDFSVLSISTPVKQNDSKLDLARQQFSQFVTPKINDLSKNQFSLSRKSSLKTPINSFHASAKKLIPYKPLLQQMSEVPENQLVLKNDDKESNTFPNFLKEKITTSSHKIPTNIHNGSTYRNEESQFSTVINTLRDDTFRRIKVNDVEYMVLDLIGRGGSSEVYQCYNVESKTHVAIKCVSLHNSASASGYINEVKLLQQLQSCSKIIKMYDYKVSESQKKLWVVLEHGGKDLCTILKQLACQKSHIPMYMLLFYWMEMLYSVRQIHSHAIIHSDLKPANFLKVDEGLKLIDFGIASSVQTDMTSVIKTKQEGSCNYISPEALISDSSTNFNSEHRNTEKYKIHYKSDVWSLGCILYQFVYRRTPFQHITQLWPKLAAIMNPEHKIDYPDAEWVSPKIVETIKKCLQYNVKSRPSVDDLITEYESILHGI